MTEVIVIVEGQTEEQFIKQVIKSVLNPLGIYIKPRLLNTSSGARGGAVSFDRLKHNAIKILRQSSAPILSTFLDLYGLDTGFPDFHKAKGETDVHRRVACLEAALREAIVEASGCRPEQFLPHVQPFEFEGLLFSDVDALCILEPEWHKYRGSLADVRQAYRSPEHIDDGYDTKPSIRLKKALDPKYDKVLHGPAAAREITLPVMEGACVHFREWMDKLRRLADTAGEA